MLWTLISISTITSLFLFHIWMVWVAIVPLLMSLYMLFTDGTLQTKHHAREFSRYHVLFGLWALIIAWSTLLLFALWITPTNIFYRIIGLHIVVIRLTLIGKHADELTMFHIGYYFSLIIFSGFLLLTYGKTGASALLFFPIVSFLLYACGSFFIHPFIPLPLSWHYRTAMSFILSFLSCIILYFFSMPILWWSAAGILLCCIIWFLVYQTSTYYVTEKKRRVGAEDILAGKRVIQPEYSIWHTTKESLVTLVSHVPYYRRTILTRSSSVLCAGALWSLRLWSHGIPMVIRLGIAIIALIIYTLSLQWWNKISYKTVWPDMLVWMFGHSIFLWVVRDTFGTHFQTSIFITMGWTLINLAGAIVIAQQTHTTHAIRKRSLLYGYCGASVLIWILVMVFFSQLWLDTLLVWAVNLIFAWVLGTFVYFFARLNK
jgi:hypothetical protein